MKQINLEQLKEVLDVLEEVFTELHVDFYMIGAIAKDYWYHRGNKKMRHTKDVDFAILIPSEEIYRTVRKRLQGSSLCRYSGKYLCHEQSARHAG